MNVDIEMVVADLENRGCVDALLYIENLEEGNCLYEESPELHNLFYKAHASEGARDNSGRNVF